MKRKKIEQGPQRKKKKGSSRKVFPEFIGKVQMTREGFIFVIIEGQEDDVFVKASKTRHALNGDIVRVAVTRSGGKDKRREGEVVEIVERSQRPFVGFLHLVGAQAWVLMQSKNMPYDIEVDLESALAMGAKTGMKVAAVVDGWERNALGPSGHVVDVLGEPGANETEMHAILAEYGLPYRFTQEVEDAADKISEEITDEDMKGRKDFRNTFTFTIDPADAKDFDDALSFRKLKNGNYEIGVHIADVSHYVRPGSPVDKEARERGTSVYLVDRTVPMLPEKLCNKLCSLRPDEDKLTFSTVFEMSPKGEIKSRWIGRTAIRSNARLDYDAAQSVIEEYINASRSQNTASPAPCEELPLRSIPPSSAGPLPFTESRVTTVPLQGPATADNYSELREAIVELHKLASGFRDKRFKSGAINFDRPEMKVDIDADGKPIGVHQHYSKEANWLIEEFMLLANRTVAEFVATAGQMNGVVSKAAKTFVYRVHGEPNFEKLEGLRGFAAGFGYKMGESNDGRSAAESLRGLLSASLGKPEYTAFENIALRSMAKAVYSTDNIGHYGLAFKFYTHFTSPIRRYPDLMVHRLLAAYLAGKDSQNKEKFEVECKHASERELVAADAERTSTKYKLVEFMQDKVGQEFDGQVSGVTEWGMYVEIEPTKIEGMVPLREIHSDFYDYDEAHYRLVGRRTQQVFQLGTPVRIKVKNANLEQRLLDYELVESSVKKQ